MEKIEKHEVMMFEKISTLIFIMTFGIILSLKMGYAKNIAYKPIEIPTKIKKLKTIGQIEPFLSSPNEDEKRGAIRRLGQLEDKETIGVLVEVFKKEPYKPEFEVWPMVKLEIVNALYENGSEEAKLALLDILNTYLTRGPQGEGERQSGQDGDYTSVVGHILRSFVKWKDDEEVWNTCRKLAFDKNITDWYVRVTAYEVYLRGKIHRAGIVSLEGNVSYLVSHLTGKSSILTTEGLKNGAIASILRSYGKPAIPYLKKELESIPSTE